MMDLSLTFSLGIGLMALVFFFRRGGKRPRAPLEVAVSDAWDNYFTHSDLEHQARQYQQVWSDQGEDGALFAVLREAAPRAFPRPSSQISATAFDPEVLSLKMSDDAISSIRGIRRILKEE